MGHQTSDHSAFQWCLCSAFMGSWWWTGRPGVLRFMGSRRVGHDWATELNYGEFSCIPASLVAQLGKNPPCNVGDLGSTPVLGRSPGEGKGYPLRPGEFDGLYRAWVTESGTTERLSLHFLYSFRKHLNMALTPIRISVLYLFKIRPTPVCSSKHCMFLWQLMWAELNYMPNKA